MMGDDSKFKRNNINLLEVLDEVENLRWLWWWWRWRWTEFVLLTPLNLKQ